MRMMNAFIHDSNILPVLNMMISYDGTLDDSDVELFDELTGIHIGFTSDAFIERMILISDELS